ncbi:hypothetical protein [Flavobacterium sp. 2]|uniref:hypothetical protein n=1 Tax=Flavobacterium sp. 2 TaxID=308053 RepID=UPI000C1A71AE|nr:hypothetical protein [Flavobacterium sp. 2]PIF60080.1 hypothetical protein CLU99_3325 [Flavobacterium sp. 2]
MNTNHNRIKIADLETNEPNKTLVTNNNGELTFNDIPEKNFKTINGESLIGDGDIVTGGDSQNLNQTLANGNTANDKSIILNYTGESNTTISGLGLHSTNNSGTESAGIASHVVRVSRNTGHSTSIVNDGIEFRNHDNLGTTKLTSNYIPSNATGIITLPLLSPGPNSRTLAAQDEIILQTVLNTNPTASFDPYTFVNFLGGNFGEKQFRISTGSHSGFGDNIKQTTFTLQKDQFNFKNEVNGVSSEFRAFNGRSYFNMIAGANSTQINMPTPTAPNISIDFPNPSTTGNYTLATTSDFKTINGESIIGSGDIKVGGGGGSQTIDSVLKTGDTAYDKIFFMRDLSDPINKFSFLTAYTLSLSYNNDQGNYGSTSFFVRDNVLKTGLYGSSTEIRFENPMSLPSGGMVTITTDPMTGVFTQKIQPKDGTIALLSDLKLKPYTVATLPAGVVGDTAYVTDATNPTYLSTLTGGGTTVCPVFYNGNTWVSH